MENVNSALDMAKDLHKDFLEKKKGTFHQLPKTLAIVDTEAFLVFLTAWEAFSAELSRLIAADDPFLLPSLSRARQIAISFEAYSDDPEQTSALDIGSFMATFNSLCQPEEGSDLQKTRDAAVDAYYTMQVASGVGPGTLEATGVHIFWPARRFYYNYKSWYDEQLFDDSDFATQDAPNWLAFLRNYYDSTSSISSGASVCVGDLTSVTAATREGQLLLTPSARQEGIEITTESEITRNTDEVLVEFGLDLTPGIGIGRRLREFSPAQTVGSHSRRDPAQIRSRFGLHGLAHQHGRRRRRLDDKDFLIVYGGSIGGAYDKSNFAAKWDGHFFLIGDSANNLEPVYAADNGVGSRNIPVFYFPNSVTVSSANFPRGSTDVDATELGGVFGYLTMAYNGTAGLITEQATLYTETRDTFSETPRSAGGQIVPVLFTEGMIDGVDAFIYVGGFFATVLDWNEENNITFTVQSWQTTLEEKAALGLENVVVNMVAFDAEKLEEETAAGIDLVSFRFPDSASSSITWASTLFVAVVTALGLHLL